MIDLHCHLLPGIDDGPATMEQALRLCRMAVDDGITHAVVTPHIHPGRWQNTREGIYNGVQLLRGALVVEGIPLQLGFAGEVRLTDEVMQQVENDQIPFYGKVDGYRIMLLEFPHAAITPGSEKLVLWLLERKIRPLIAHPERNKQVMKDPRQLTPFLDAGCWLQVTAGSVIGKFGERARKIAQMLLRENLVKVIASDGHNETARPPLLRQAFGSIASEYGEGRAGSLFCKTPAAIVADQIRNQNRVTINAAHTGNPGSASGALY